MIGERPRITAPLVTVNVPAVPVDGTNVRRTTETKTGTGTGTGIGIQGGGEAGLLKGGGVRPPTGGGTTRYGPRLPWNVMMLKKMKTGQLPLLMIIDSLKVDDLRGVCFFYVENACNRKPDFFSDFFRVAISFAECQFLT
jgi:hypothetical protein